MTLQCQLCTKMLLRAAPLPARLCSFPSDPSDGGTSWWPQQTLQCQCWRQWNSPRSASARSYTSGLPAGSERLYSCQRGGTEKKTSALNDCIHSAQTTSTYFWAERSLCWIGNAANQVWLKAFLLCFSISGLKKQAPTKAQREHLCSEHGRLSAFFVGMFYGAARFSQKCLRR